MAYYFVSDVHAGLAVDGKPAESGERFAAWLDAVAADAEAIFLLGDIFDFWFEYKRAVPAGFDSLLDRFRMLTARGIKIHFFPGNHDMWTLDYLAHECGLIVHTEGLYTTLCGRHVYLEHGDRQSIGGIGERLMQKLFRSPIARRLARALVPAPAMLRFGTRWSRANRTRHTRPHTFRAENEGMVRFARHYLQTHAVDIFVFGHLHVPAAYPLSDRTILYVLGDWISTPHPVYGRLDADGFSLLQA